MNDLPRLNRALVLSSAIQDRKDLSPPAPAVFDLPERVLQFGSGRFLRGFADYFIDRAIRQGRFDGRVVVVQSTGSGRSDGLDAQDGLYTLVVQGLEDGEAVEAVSIIGAVSRALSAGEAWGEVLACARNPALTCVVSNTTEVGIRLDEEDALDLDPPRSFPGKLTAFLYARAQAFDYDVARGVVVLPCELVEDNGDALRSIVLSLAKQWELDARFVEWVTAACPFPNTLVDRIVTGMPGDAARDALQARLGYEDRLLTTAEVYRLWAVEGAPDLRERLPFLEGDPGIVVASDITPYRELKVRILNGTHTAMVELAYLAGNDTVRGALEDAPVAAFVQGLVFDEIVPSLKVPPAQARRFAEAVLQRFRNPFIEHLLINITFQATSKMRHRVVPSLLAYHEKQDAPPRRLLFGFAAYLAFMRAVAREADGTHYGERGGVRYPINDEQAPFFYEQWQEVDPGSGESIEHFVTRVCTEEALWGTSLTAVPQLCATVARYLRWIVQDGPRAALRQLEAEHAEAA